MNNDLHVNYRFVLDFAKRNAPLGKILDYGCGSGQVVRAGLDNGLDILGCEVFYGGGHGTEDAVSDLLGTRIFKIEDGNIPFNDSCFDCVVNNQVFEHVEDMDAVLSQIYRVLKPGGYLLSLFPSREVIREGHCGVPLAHRFSKYPRLCYYWLLAFRLLGVGYFKESKSPKRWAHDFQIWLRDYCIYRPEKEIMEIFSRQQLSPVGIEQEYIRFRNLPLFTPWLLRKLGFMVLLSRKN
jgi:SAM-dependent methyltransferase